MSTRGRTTGSLLLAGLLVLWLVSPIGWLFLSGLVHPDSGTHPTAQQRHDMALVTLTELVIAIGLPLLVLVIAGLTRRRTLAAVAGIALVALNLLLIFIEAPIWELFAESIRTLW
ncbi:hypothetical protein [Rhizocola hellebori]|nr:hypothetical protein [Rhizocola hellebori]